MIATSSIYGMPKPWHPDPTQTLASTPAPAPDMSSEAVLAAAPKTRRPPVNERSATADAAPKKKRVVARKPPPDDARQNYAWSRRIAQTRSRAGRSPGTFGRF